jgi:hypothetical protein
MTEGLLFSIKPTTWQALKEWIKGNDDEDLLSESTMKLTMPEGVLTNFLVNTEEEEGIWAGIIEEEHGELTLLTYPWAVSLFKSLEDTITDPKLKIFIDQVISSTDLSEYPF